MTPTVRWYQLKSWEKSRFRDRQGVAELPLTLPTETTEVDLLLTDAPQSLDLVRVKFEKR